MTDWEEIAKKMADELKKAEQLPFKMCLCKWNIQIGHEPDCVIEKALQIYGQAIKQSKIP